MPIAMNEVVYTCKQCGAKDTMRLFQDEAVPAAINCWKCGAGRRHVTTAEQVMAGVGMFPAAKETTSGRRP